MDETASRRRLAPQNTAELRQERASLRMRIEDALNERDFTLAAELRKQEKKPGELTGKFTLTCAYKKGSSK